MREHNLWGSSVLQDNEVETEMQSKVPNETQRGDSSLDDQLVFSYPSYFSFKSLHLEMNNIGMIHFQI